MTDLTQRLRDLVAINRAIVGTLDHSEVLRLVVDKTAAFTGADACALLLYDADGWLRVAAAHGIEPEAAARVAVPFDERVNVALREMLGYRQDDSFLGVPVMRQNRIQGLLVVYRRGPTTARPDDEFLLRALADQAAIALEHARRYGELSEARARQSRLLETIQSNTTTCLAYLDRDLRFVEANAAYSRATGRARSELVGRVYQEAFPDDTSASVLEEVRATSRAAEVTEMPVSDDSGSTRWWDWSARPIQSPEGAVEGLVVSAVDVTEKVQARRELETASRNKDEFLAMLAHELRNPLAAISSAVEILRTRAVDDAVLVRAGAAASRQIDHMVRLLDDLLDVSRITRGKIELEREPVDLRAVLEGAVEAARPAIASRRHELSISLPSEAVSVDGDPHRLVQIVSNLLTNAAKYNAAGGHIELTLVRAGPSAEIRVRDDGIGISPDFLPQVFDLFAQAERALDRTQGGLGIGLTLVKRLVEMHGGRIDAHSEGLGRGSEFVVRLPAITHTVQASAEPEHSGGEGALRVLVVEDNPDAAQMLGTLLELDGHDVTIAGDGPRALELAPRCKPDVVLLDIGLPGMDGYEVARRLRAEEIHPKPRIVAMTGYGRLEDRQRGESAGMDSYLVKPVGRESIRRVLQPAARGTRDDAHPD